LRKVRCVVQCEWRVALLFLFQLNTIFFVFNFIVMNTTTFIVQEPKGLHYMCLLLCVPLPLCHKQSHRILPSVLSHSYFAYGSGTVTRKKVFNSLIMVYYLKCVSMNIGRRIFWFFAFDFVKGNRVNKKRK